MLEGQDIIYLANDFHADNRTSSHHIAEQLARHNRLLYIEAGGTRRPRASGRDVRRIFQKIRRWLSGARREGENVWVGTLFLLPFHGSSLVRRVNRFLVVRTVRLLAHRLGMKDPILWVVLPHVGFVVEEIPHKAAVYYCVDDYMSMPLVDAQAMRAIEQDLLKRADIVFAVSESVCERLKQFNPNTHYSPHGVDLQHFRKALDPKTAIPPDLASLPRPVVGFFGLIEEWIDLELIEYMAKIHPEWSIVMIGRVAVDISRFETMPNVHFLGRRPYKQLPAYAKGFDVALMPYVLNGQVLNSNPIKLREYLAAGLPAVTVRAREMERYADVVAIADSREDFLKKVEESISTRTPEAIARRQEAVADASWEACVGRISSIVKQHLHPARTIEQALR